MIEAIKNNKVFSGIIAILIVGFLGTVVYLNHLESDEPIDETEEVHINDSVNTVTSNEVKENIQEGGPYAFVLGDDTCPACLMFKNNLRQLVAEEGIQLDYIDLQVEAQSDVEDLLEYLEYDMSQGLSTPTTFVIEDEEVVSTVIGAIEVEDLLAENGEIILQLDSTFETETNE